jgi:hypothetical protein
MSNVVQFRPRPVALLWSPRRGTNPAWRLRAESRVLQMEPRRFTLAYVGDYKLFRSAVGTFHINNIADSINYGVFRTRAEAEERLLGLLEQRA